MGVWHKNVKGFVAWDIHTFCSHALLARSISLDSAYFKKFIIVAIFGMSMQLCRKQCGPQEKMKQCMNPTVPTRNIPFV
jgi:hypothetical protein